MISGLAGLWTATLALILLWLHRRRSARAMEKVGRVHEKLTEGIIRQESTCSERFHQLKRELSSLELNMQTTEEVLKDGRLSRSGRAQAMRLLRSGITPETAATTLGVARNEMRLLAKVSEILNTNS